MSLDQQTNIFALPPWRIVGLYFDSLNCVFNAVNYHFGADQVREVTALDRIFHNEASALPRKKKTCLASQFVFHGSILND